jgi:hypothetical protein
MSKIKGFEITLPPVENLGIARKRIFILKDYVSDANSEIMKLRAPFNAEIIDLLNLKCRTLDNCAEFGIGSHT